MIRLRRRGDVAAQANAHAGYSGYASRIVEFGLDVYTSIDGEMQRRWPAGTRRPPPRARRPQELHSPKKID
jgi:hypothetical protein